MSESVMIDRNFMRFLPFINDVSRDEYKDMLLENETVTPEILERELSIYDYIEKRYSGILEQVRKEDLMFDFVINECKFFNAYNIVLGETDEAIIQRIVERLDRFEKEEENRIKNEILRKKKKKRKMKLKIKNRRK